MTPLRTYRSVYLALIALTIATTLVAFVDLGPLNTPVAILIGVIKSSLVIVFFMHLFRGERSSLIPIGAGILLLAVLIALSLADLATRG